MSAMNTTQDLGQDETQGESTTTQSRGRKGKGNGGRAEEKVEEVTSDFRELGERVRRIVQDVSQTLMEEAKRRPGAALGIAVGVGFVLGGGLSTRLGRMALVGVVELALRESGRAGSVFH